jgi:hypothetical protein
MSLRPIIAKEISLPLTVTTPQGAQITDDPTLLLLMRQYEVTAKPSLRSSFDLKPRSVSNSLGSLNSTS